MSKQHSVAKGLGPKGHHKRNRKQDPLQRWIKASRPFSFKELWVQFVYDVSEFCPELLASLELTDEELPSFVSGLLSQAETTLAWGGIEKYTILRQADAFLSKNPSVGVGNDTSRERNALKRFVDAEAKCRRTNRRLAHYADFPFRGNPAVREVVNMARLSIHRKLPELTTKLLCNIISGGGFGPGTSFTLPGERGRHLSTKLAQPVSYTDEALPYIFLLRKTHPRLWECWNESGCVRVEGNRLAFVPKNADTFRTIAVEPLANTFCLKGFEGFFVRKVLPKFGVYLWDQGFNSRMAESGSIDGKSVTIDLSSASDTLSIQLVRWLLPAPWFCALDDLRSHHYVQKVNGRKVVTRYEKFSSMGNAMTFPLESMIFKALVDAAVSYCGADPSLSRCYGDDIVVDRKAACLLIEALSFCGFSVNTGKSCLIGPFRETCGSDYVAGFDVRPVYIKDEITLDERTGLTRVMSLHNRLLTSPCAPLLHGTLRYLRAICPDGPIGPPVLVPKTFVPGWGDVDAGTDQYYFSDPPPVQYHSAYQSYGWQQEYITPKLRALSKLDILVSELRSSLRPDLNSMVFLRNGSSNVLPQKPRLSVRRRWYWSWPSLCAFFRLHGGGARPSKNNSDSTELRVV